MARERHTIFKKFVTTIIEHRREPRKRSGTIKKLTNHPEE